MKKEDVHTQDVIANYDSLAENQRFLSTLISNLPGYVYRCHEESGLWYTQFASDGIYDLTGFNSTDFLKGGSKAYGTLVHIDDQKIVREVVNHALQSQKPYQITYRIYTAEQKIKWVWEQGRGVYSDSGELIATEGFITDISEKKLVEEEILKRNEELAILNHIGQSLSKIAKVDDIIELIFTMIGRLFDNRSLYIALFDEVDRTISFPVYTLEGDIFQPGVRPFGKGLTEYIIKTNSPLLVERNLPAVFKKLGIEMLGRKSRCLISVPIASGEKVLGVITLQDYHNENVYDKSQLELLMTIASQAAIALENSFLFGALQQELDDKKQTETKIKASLREKELLLQEVHHRVKNNLQIMSSLLRLQSSHIKNPEVQKIFLESENRIKAMAIVHNKLYNSKNYEKINFKDYIKTLTNNLFLSYGVNANQITLNLELGDVELNIDTAIPCGLVINELISNSLKYAFPNARKGRIDISLTYENDNDMLVLTVKDDGIGFKNGTIPLTGETLGMKLVQLLTAQLDGKFVSNLEKGSEFKIIFKEIKYKDRT